MHGYPLFVIHVLFRLYQGFQLTALSVTYTVGGYIKEVGGSVGLCPRAVQIGDVGSRVCAPAVRESGFELTVCKLHII